MATEQQLTANSGDPIEKLYRNASKKLDVGDINNFKRLLSNESSRKSIYEDLIDVYGDPVKTKIGQDFNAFTAQYGGQKKNQRFARLKDWWCRFFEWLADFPKY